MKTDTVERNQKIEKRYSELKDTGEQDEVFQKIADEFGLGRFYIKNILKTSGVSMERKRKHTRTEHLSDRDKNIIVKAEAGDSPETIAAEFDITPTRVRQILRSNLPKFKLIKLERTLASIKEEVYQGVSYDDIVKKHGDKTIRDIKSNLGYNLFKACKDQRDANIVKMSNEGMSANQIAEAFASNEQIKQWKDDVKKWEKNGERGEKPEKPKGLSKDYVYTILHRNGVRKDTNKIVDPKKRQARNKRIIEEYKKGEGIGPIAKKSKLSYTMVKLIINEAVYNAAIEAESKPNALSEIAAQFHMSVEDVMQIVNDAQKKKFEAQQK